MVLLFCTLYIPLRLRLMYYTWFVVNLQTPYIVPCKLFCSQPSNTNKLINNKNIFLYYKHFINKY